MQRCMRFGSPGPASTFPFQSQPYAECHSNNKLHLQQAVEERLQLRGCHIVRHVQLRACANAHNNSLVH